MSKERKNCMCTAMLYDPKDHYEPEETKQFFEENKKSFERLFRFKEWKFLQPFLKKSEKPAKLLKMVLSSFFNF
jgi:succinate dehydrogenase flavin-adding protein (antitoxin of CptAB toxin-antitoxin module)